MEFTRRDVARIALAGLPPMRALAANDSTFGGVRIGINTFSFRGLPLDEVIRQVSAASIGFMEVESTFVEPGTAMPAGGPGGGAFVPFGDGDVPIKDILLQAKRGHHTYVVMIERIYSVEGSDTQTETKRSLEYFKRVLTS